MKKPIYRVGDKVLVKKQYDPGYKDTDYPCFFSSFMLKRYGGTILTIESCYLCRASLIAPIPLEFDGYTYTVKENTYFWSSPMFDPISSEL